MFLIIGSTATYHWFPEARRPLDLDLLTPTKLIGPGVVDGQWHDAAEEVIRASKDPVFADPDLLFTIKLSHAHWDIKWAKTMYDIEFLRRKGAKVNHRIYHLLYAVWEKVHGAKRVNLNKTNTELFMDAVKRDVDHDELHRRLAFYAEPLHTRIRPKDGSAWCSQELFLDLPDDDQFKVALEEMMVVAVERSGLTAASSMSDVHLAMSRAHKALCTTMTTGWFARFLIINHYELLSKRRDEWMTHMRSRLA